MDTRGRSLAVSAAAPEILSAARANRATRAEPITRPVAPILIGAAVLVVAWLAFMVWVPFHAWGKVHRLDAEPDGARPAASKGYDYVLVGSDSREGLTAEQQKQLNTGAVKDAPGKRTDSIILVGGYTFHRASKPH